MRRERGRFEDVSGPDAPDHDADGQLLRVPKPDLVR